VILKASMTERIAQGLYDPAFERDSCGFGLIANLDDMPSHWVVETAISALARLTHRGAVAADGKTRIAAPLLLMARRVTAAGCLSSSPSAS
jgi:glutamate synthase (NADPH/NADH) large chain